MAMSASTAPPAGAVEADIAISHTYVGDLDVVVGVLDPSGNAICAVEVLRSDPSDASSDFTGTFDVSACAANYPPGPSNIWALVAIDNAAIDVGTITQFTLRGPDGVTRQGAVPVQIPDNDPNGALVLLNP